MAHGNQVTIIGNLTRDPELKYTQNGYPYANFGIAWNQTRFYGKPNQEEVAHFFDVTLWGDSAENVAESVTKGMRVVVHGRLDYRTWESDQGRRSKVQIVADEVTPSLRWATAQVMRTPRDGETAPAPPPQRARQAPPAAPAYEEDEEPF